MRGFIEHVTNRSETEILIIGAGCSVSTQPVAALAPFWNMVQVRKILANIALLYVYIYTYSIEVNLISQISPRSSSPRLSDRDKFPTFLRTVPSIINIAPGIVKLMQHFDWKYVAIITQEVDLFTLVITECLHCISHTRCYIP